MTKKTIAVLGAGVALVLGFTAGRVDLETTAAADGGKLTALDYAEITQLINRYAYGIDTCGGNVFFFSMMLRPQRSFLFPYTALFRSRDGR